MGLRLGFHYHVPAEKRNGQIYMPGYLGRFIDSLADECDQVVCFMHTPLPEEKPLMDYPLRSQNVKLMGLGPHSSLPQRVLHVRQGMNTVRSSRGQIDALLIRGPTPLLPWVAKACRPLPFVLLLVGDQLAGVDDLPQPRWRKEAIRAFWKWNAHQQLLLAKQSLTFVNSHRLYTQLEEKVSKLVETRTSTLEESDFYTREDTCLNRPVRLLYTGRMDRAKGLLDMVNALSILVSQGENVVLDLVGWGEKGSTILEEIQQLGRQKNLANRVFYHGYQPVGPELFTFYKQADIYLIASQSSEGFPRTIWEAMANCLPVVTTKVGSIPDYLRDGKDALLVDPREPVHLADQINNLIHNVSLRQELIRNGFILAKSNTIRYRTKEMIPGIQRYLECKNRFS
jgi:glycosyltransferase involved in cell wall biosynthesis